MLNRMIFIQSLLLLPILIKLVDLSVIENIKNTEEYKEIEGRISGGELAKENQFPHQVGLSIEVDNGQWFWCGASIISLQWILTAAHCLEGLKSSTAYLGSTKRLQSQQMLKLSPKNVIIHELWNNQTYENDIALLYSSTPIIYTAGVQAVQLPKLNDTHSMYIYRQATATGWGRTSDSSVAISDDLRYIVRFVESNDECRLVYPTSIKDSNICIDTTSGKSTCNGDSGGPLVIYETSNGTQTTVLIGLSSFGKRIGCTKGYPAVFTRITSYVKWIYEKTGIVNK